MARRRRPADLELAATPTVLAFDPGGVSGWSIMSVHPDCLDDPEVKILDNIEFWEHGQIRGPEERQASSIAGIIDNWPGAVIVVEDFILRKFNQSRDLLLPVRITAMISYHLWQNRLTMRLQQPSEAMNTATDERLKSWGLYKSEGGEQHARDADRHAITWLRKCKSGKRSRQLRCESWEHIYGKYVPNPPQPAPKEEMFQNLKNGRALGWSNMAKSFQDRNLA